MIICQKINLFVKKNGKMISQNEEKLITDDFSSPLDYAAPATIKPGFACIGLAYDSVRGAQLTKD